MSVAEDHKLAMRQIAEDAAEHAVKRTLTALGVDHRNPLETQRDLAALRELRMLVTDQEFQADLQHLRYWRRTVNSAQAKGIIAAMALLVVGGVTFILTGLGFKLPG